MRRMHFVFRRLKSSIYSNFKLCTQQYPTETNFNNENSTHRLACCPNAFFFELLSILTPWAAQSQCLSTFHFVSCVNRPLHDI